MAAKVKSNFWDDMNDLMNTDMSPGQPGDRAPISFGDYNYQTIFPWGERKKPAPKKPVDPAKLATEANKKSTARRDSKKEIAAKKAKAKIAYMPKKTKK